MTDAAISSPAHGKAHGPTDLIWQARTLSTEQLRHEVDDGAIDIVIVASTDIQGKLFGKQVSAELFVGKPVREIHVSCSTLMYDNDWAIREGFPDIGAHNAWADMELSPDLMTLRRWDHQPRSAICLADASWSDHTPVEYLPRRILTRQVARCKELGLLPICAAECEFYLFGERHDDARQKNWANLIRLEETSPDYSVFRPNLDEAVLGAIRRHAVASGIPTETLKHEAGKGQYELSLTPCDPVEAADRAHLFKTLVKEIADQRGMCATFMARHDHREAGSSGHLHQSIWNSEASQNLFVADADPRTLSEFGRWWLGGQMAYAPELMPLFCPNVNSYKRLDVDVFGPATLSWGGDVRTVAYRIVGAGSGLNFENRIPGADANFYLALAAMIASGLEGIEKRIEPFGEPTPDSREVYGTKLPASLSEALDRFEHSAFARRVFGDKIVDHLVNDGRQDHAVYQREVSDIERRRYFQWS